MNSLLKAICRLVAVVGLFILPLITEAQTKGTAQRPFGGLPPSQLPGNVVSPTQAFPSPLVPSTNVPGIPPIPGQPNQIQGQVLPPLPGLGAGIPNVPGTGPVRAAVPGSSQAAPQPGQ